MDFISYSLAAKANKTAILVQNALPDKANLLGNALGVPTGTTGERPILTASDKAIRYNTTIAGLEQWDGTSWENISATVTAVNLKGTDTVANILAMTGMVAEDLWIASDTLDGYIYDGTSWINIGALQGPQGVQGNTGVGITSITRTAGDGSAGTTDTYTITFSDASTTTYDVVNGVDGVAGADGQGIDHVIRTAGTGAAGTTDTYTVWGDAGETINLGTLDITNGNTIDHVTRTVGTGAAGTTDTYTIYGDIGETEVLGTFDVYNGNDGGGVINDTITTTTTLWSSQKTSDQIKEEAIAMAIALG